MEQVKLTSTLGHFGKLENGKFMLHTDEKGNLKSNFYFTPGFVMKDGNLSLAIVNEGPKIAYSMADRIAEIAKEILIPKGIVKGVVLETKGIAYYKENAIEAFIINGIFCL